MTRATVQFLELAVFLTLIAAVLLVACVVIKYG